MMQVENVKYFSVTVFIIKDFCTVQTFPLLLAYLIIRFLKLRAELVCCAKTCFGPLEDQIWKMRFIFPNVPYSCQIPLVPEHLTLTLVKYLLIKVVALLGHEQLLYPLSSSDIFLKVMDQTQKWTQR